MSGHPRASLAHVLEQLATIIDVACGDVTQVEQVGDVIILDPLVDPLLAESALVLGVGLSGGGQIVEVLDRLGRQRASGLVVRAPMVPDSAVVEASERWAVPVFRLSRGVTWLQLTGRIRSIVSARRAEYADASTLGGIRSGDLMGVANALGDLLCAPVTIEDRESRVLAFATPQVETAHTRSGADGRAQAPPQLPPAVERRAVLQEVYDSHSPVFVSAERRSRVAIPETEDASSDGARAAIAVRAGNEILGTIWVAVTEPLSVERAQALHAASKLVAMHLMWQRADANAERRLRADRLSTALDGGVGSLEAARLLGVRNEPCVVLALDVADAGEAHVPAQLAADRIRLSDAFAMHLSAAHRRSVAGVIGEVIYGILPIAVRGEPAEEQVLRVAREFLDHVRPRPRGLIAIGSIASDMSGLGRSRGNADRVLRVLRAGLGIDQVARLDDVLGDALLMEFGDRISDADLPTGAVARLVAYDSEHESSLVETLRAWLDSFGDVPAAAAALYVHPNTFRYRLRKAADVGQVDLGDPRERFAAMLQLRLLAVKAAC